MVYLLICTDLRKNYACALKCAICSSVDKLRNALSNLLSFFCRVFLEVLIIFIPVMGMTYGKDVVTSYPCPNQCNCYQGSLEEEVVSVVCRLDYIHLDADFSFVRTPITSILYIICSSQDVVSQVRDNMFNTLESFMGLSIDNCRISYLPSKFLFGMTSLEQIEIKSAGTLEMDETMFHQTPTLTHITIAYSHVTKMPDLCQSSNLKYVNITDNDLQSMESTGLMCKNNTDLPNLSTLILDKNSIFNISKGTLKSMPNLKDLRIADGNLISIEAGALSDVRQISFLDITNNAITNVSTDLLSSCPDINVLGLGGNPLNRIHPATFSNVTKLLVLTLDHSGLDDRVWESLHPLDHLKDLQLQGNNITKLNKTVMFNLGLLQNLNLGNNDISDLSTGMFTKMTDLQFLHLHQNNLTTIHNETFLGLQKIFALDLHGNKIRIIHKNGFRPFVSLKELDLSDNLLTEVPHFSETNRLQSVDLSFNRIKTIHSESLKSLRNLTRLFLSNNLISKIEAGVFTKFYQITMIDISFNKLHRIIPGTFEGLPRLASLFLQGNDIVNITLNSKDLPALKALNLSLNSLSFKIESWSFPNSTENLDLSFNNISDITDYAFYNFKKLRRLSLKGNRLSSLAEVDLTVPLAQSKTTMVYIAENPFICDCELRWLRQKVNEISMDTGFPVIGDMYSVECENGYRIEQPVLLYTVQPEDMLCSYKYKCTNNCYCCEFEPCDCSFVCPPGCSCYNSADFMTTHFVQCSDRGLTEVPSSFPAMSTEVTLDRNNISAIHSRSFVGLIYLRVIHLDHCDIMTLDNYSFIGLLQLKILHLNNNNIQNITNGVFSNLWNLTELHLEYNQISFIEEGAFSSLNSLSKLFLSHNQLLSLPQSAINLFWSLSNITLGKNPWTCDCDIMVDFLPVLMNKTLIISDYKSMICVDTNANISIKEVSAKMCPNIIQEKVTDVEIIGSENWPKILKILIIISASIILTTFVIIIGICLWRPARLFLNRKCKCCDRKELIEDDGKCYDAFLAYSHRDDDYVTREFIPRLENDRNYKLCVYYRDFPVGGTMKETINDSISRSKRTILLVSKNFNDHEWKNSAFQHSFQTLFRQKNNCLIVVLLDDTKGRNLETKLNKLVRSHPVISYRDMSFWEKLQYMMGQSKKRSIIRNDTPDIILNHSVPQQDDDGYETPVSSSASHAETDKYYGLERRSLESINNIYEEIRSSKLSDVSLV